MEVQHSSGGRNVRISEFFTGAVNGMWKNPALKTQGVLLGDLITAAHLRVFNGARAQGNTVLCLLYDCLLYEKAPETIEVRAFADACDSAVCVGWWERGALEVRCMQAGRTIQFCGHGLLAAAHLWRISHTPEISVSLILRSNDRHYLYEKRDDRWWLGAPRISCRRMVDVRPAQTPWVPAPIASAVAGGADGYRIWEWDMGTDIAHLIVEKREECEFLQRDARATIFTARSGSDVRFKDGTRNDGVGGDDYVLRYLAPQYRSAEDAATGSANAILADYWQQRGLEPPFQARQCSPGGGEIVADIDARRAWITGAVEITQ